MEGVHWSLFLLVVYFTQRYLAAEPLALNCIIALVYVFSLIMTFRTTTSLNVSYHSFGPSHNYQHVTCCKAPT